MLSQLFIDILPCLNALVGGILVGTIFRPLSRYLAQKEELTETQSRGLVLLSARNICIILAIVFTILVFTKYEFSFYAILMVAYLLFLISSMLWGIMMGLVKRFVTSQHAIKIFQKL
jgi:hypothetical protein